MENNWPTTSENIEKLASALSQTQGEIESAKKNAENKFFHQKYADLASVWDAIRKPLSSHGLAIIQTTEYSENNIIIITTLLHSSGQWIRGKFAIKPIKQDPQGLGSAFTYGRRYSLSAIIGIAPDDDDDAENSMNRKINTNKPNNSLILKTTQNIIKKSTTKSLKNLQIAKKLALFKAEKFGIGKNKYYEILGLNGFEHSNDVPLDDVSTQNAIYDGMMKEAEIKFKLSKKDIIKKANEIKKSISKLQAYMMSHFNTTEWDNLSLPQRQSIANNLDFI